METTNLIEVRNLKKYFPVKTDFLGRPVSWLKAVDDVSFGIKKGETLGLVGESGCGKSTTGRTLLQLYRPTAGKVLLNGKEVTSLPEKEIRRRMQMIFQDPYASLNPRMTVGDIIGEPLDIHNLAQGKARQERITQLLAMVGLNPAYSSRFPHEFSGGQRQRIGIARALAVEPEFMVCDEPISALDVSIQAQVVNLLENLQQSLGLTYLFIAHDLAMVKHISRRVAVMYLGKIVELADSQELYTNPQHPYTKVLLASIPIPDPMLMAERAYRSVPGELQSPVDPPPGCRFKSRCPHALPVCGEAEPLLKTTGTSHYTACHLL